LKKTKKYNPPKIVIKLSLFTVEHGEKMSADSSDLDAMLGDLEKQIRGLDDLKDVAKHVADTLRTERAQFNKMVESARKFAAASDENADIVRFNVGGKHFSTLKSTLSKRIVKPREQDDSCEDREEEKELCKERKEQKEKKKPEKEGSAESKRKEEGEEKDADKEQEQEKGSDKGEEKRKESAKEPSREFYEPNLLEALANGLVDVKLDDSNAIFIDRNPKYFGMILDYLRCANTDEKFELPKHETDLNGMVNC
jgi:hypothetical protein